jgi:hypothetical protein
MKKLILIPLLFFAIFSVNAKALSEYDYVITKNGTFYCQQVNVGLLHIKGILENGEALKVSVNEVRAYKANGRIFERMPIYQNDKITSNSNLMELLSLKDGLKLFRYTLIDNNEALCPGHNQYYVFRNGEYVLQVSDKSSYQVFNFFNVSQK